MQAEKNRLGFRDDKLAAKHLKPGAHPLNVSIIQLLAHPEQYENKAVRFCGFYRTAGDEDSCIYLSAEDSNYWMGKNGLWVRQDLSGIRGHDFNRKYVLIEGIFDTEFMGHMDLNSGEMRHVWRVMALEKAYND